jgi:hypothetical protein
MSTYSNIKNSRRLVWMGIIVGYAVAAGVATLNLIGGDNPLLAAAAFLVMASLPPTIALLSLDRRPSLLNVAIMAAVFQGVVLGPVGWILFIVAVLWVFAVRQRPTIAPTPKGSSVWRPLLAAATVLPLVVMFSHLDPVCTITDSEGRVSEVEADNFPQGWRWFGLGSITTESSTGGDFTSRRCVSDTVQSWEAALSIALSAGIAGVALRWQTNDRLVPVLEARHPPG